MCVFSLLIISFISYTISYKMVLSATESQIDIASKKYSQEIDYWLEKQSYKLHGIKEDLEINASYYKDKNRLVNMLKRKLKDSNGVVYDYYIGFNDKSVLSAIDWKPPVDYDCTMRDWYKQAIEDKGVIYTTPYIDIYIEKMVITIAEPIVIDGNIIGVLAADITVDYLVKLVDGIKIVDNSYAFLIDNEKGIMTHPEKHFLPTGKKAFNINKILEGKFKVLGDQIDKAQYKITELKDYDGLDKYFILSTINSSNWVLGFSIPKSEITKNLYALMGGFIVAFIISIFITIIVIFFLSNSMLNPVLNLTRIVKQFGNKKMDVRCQIDSNDEIGELGRSFNEMAKLIQEYSMTLEEKVEERTVLLKEKNLKIQDSIEYAKMIQMTILPDKDEIGQVLKDYFVIWKPRDVVGGDLYWMRKFDDGFIVLVGDCTGHGVPGALMTMAVNAILDHIVNDICHNNPAIILKELDRLLNHLLHREGTETSIQDGLDAGIVYVSKHGKMLYAGAQIPLFIVKDGEATEIKGSRQTIGSEMLELEKDFINHEIEYKKGTSFYLISDGLQDQVGGESHLPLGKNRLLTSLKSIQHLSMEEQKHIVWSNYKDFLNGEIQRDDVTIFGFRL